MKRYISVAALILSMASPAAAFAASNCSAEIQAVNQQCTAGNNAQQCRSAEQAAESCLTALPPNSKCTALQNFMTRQCKNGANSFLACAGAINQLGACQDVPPVGQKPPPPGNPCVAEQNTMFKECYPAPIPPSNQSIPTANCPGAKTAYLSCLQANNIPNPLAGNPEADYHPKGDYRISCHYFVNDSNTSGKTAPNEMLTVPNCRNLIKPPSPPPY